MLMPCKRRIVALPEAEAPAHPRDLWRLWSDSRASLSSPTTKEAPMVKPPPPPEVSGDASVDTDIVHEDPGLSVRAEQDGETLVVSASGQLDSSNAQTLERELRLAIASDIPELLLDLGGLSFIDSAGLRVLAVIARLSRRNGERLRMLPGSPPVELAIEASGVERSLPLVS